jgi:hypothetical protein
VYSQQIWQNDPENAWQIASLIFLMDTTTKKTLQTEETQWSIMRNNISAKKSDLANQNNRLYSYLRSIN